MMAGSSAASATLTSADRLHFIDGAYTAGDSGKTFDNRSPVDGSKICLVHEAGPAEVEAAVRAARTALSGDWGRLSVAARCALLGCHIRTSAGCHSSPAEEHSLSYWTVSSGWYVWAQAPCSKPRNSTVDASLAKP